MTHVDHFLIFIASLMFAALCGLAIVTPVYLAVYWLMQRLFVLRRRW